MKKLSENDVAQVADLVQHMFAHLTPNRPLPEGRRGIDRATDLVIGAAGNNPQTAIAALKAAMHEVGISHADGHHVICRNLKILDCEPLKTFIAQTLKHIAPAELPARTTWKPAEQQLPTVDVSEDDAGLLSRHLLVQIFDQAHKGIEEADIGLQIEDLGDHDLWLFTQNRAWHSVPVAELNNRTAAFILDRALQAKPMGTEFGSAARAAAITESGLSEPQVHAIGHMVKGGQLLTLSRYLGA